VIKILTNVVVAVAVAVAVAWTWGREIRKGSEESTLTYTDIVNFNTY
jgi:uncharacterized membrane protein